jgi:hypothetical protein
MSDTERCSRCGERSGLHTLDCMLEEQQEQRAIRAEAERLAKALGVDGRPMHVTVGKNGRNVRMLVISFEDAVALLHRLQSKENG